MPRCKSTALGFALIAAAISWCVAGAVLGFNPARVLLHLVAGAAAIALVVALLPWVAAVFVALAGWLLRGLR